MCDVDISVNIPCIRNVIPEFGITAVLLEVHIVTVSVRAVVRAADHTREPPFPDPVGQFGLQCVVGAVTDICVCIHAICLHLAGDDVDHAAHGVRPIEH